jgi:transcriptional regulator with XRE-family HTH domain
MRSFPLSLGKKLNRRLEYLLKARGINTQQLHKFTGIPLSTLKRLRLNKESNPTLASLIPIAKYFSVTMDQLIGIRPLKKNNCTPNNITLPILRWKDILSCYKDGNKCAFSSLLITDGTSFSQDAYGLIIQEEKWINFLAGSLLIIEPFIKPKHRDFIIIYKKGACSPELYQLLILANKPYLNLPIYNSEIVPFTGNYKNLGVVIQIRMNYKNNKMHVNSKDKKPSYNANKY